MSKVNKTLDELLEEALVPEEEQPYEVPENWVWSRLGNIFDLINEQVDPSGNEKYIGLEHMKTGGGLSSIGESEGLKSKKVRFKLGDVLYGKLRPYLDKHSLVDFDGVASTDILVYRSQSRTLNQLLDFYLGLPHVVEYANENSNGINLPRVSPKIMSKLPFPLPPLQEQKRIVDRTELMFIKLDEAKILIEEAREGFEKRKATILSKAFRGELTKKWREEHTDIESADVLFNKSDSIELQYELPDKWIWVRMDEICDVNPKKIDKINILDDQICTFVPMASVSEISGKIEVYEKRKFKEVKKGFTNFLEGDILFAKITPSMENGKAAIAEKLLNGFAYGTTEFHVIRTSKYIYNIFVYHLIRSKWFRDEAKSHMTGVVGQQRVPKSFLEEYVIALPPIEEQKEIVRILNRILEQESQIMELTKLEEQIESIKRSILNKAFRGKLGTNYSEDENASGLLKEVLRVKTY